MSLERTRSTSPASDFPSYTGSVIIASYCAPRRIASIVESTGMP